MSPVNRESSGVALIFNGNVLLAKRVEEWEGKPLPYGGYWSIFGGSMEEGESPSVCAARELEEEAKINCNENDLIFIKSFVENGNRFHFHILEVKELLIPQLNEEHTASGWYKINSLNSFTEKIDKKIIKCLEIYCKNV